MNKIEIQQILNKWGIKMTLDEILSHWAKPHRYFHTEKHLEDLINKINQRRMSISFWDYEKLIIVALFHDIVYDPKSSTNEEDSAKMFMDNITYSTSPDNKIEKSSIDEINQAIIDTKTHKPTTFVSKIFCDLDMSVIEGSYEDLLEWEGGIYGEYQSYGKEAYKAGRLSFLKTLPEQYPHNAENLSKLITWVEQNY